MAKFDRRTNAPVLIYPVLISPNISNMPIAGMIKELEKFILLYRMNDIIQKMVPDGLAESDQNFELDFSINEHIEHISEDMSISDEINSFLNEQKSLPPPKSAKTKIKAKAANQDYPIDPDAISQSYDVSVSKSIDLTPLQKEAQLLPTFVTIKTKIVSSKTSKGLLTKVFQGNRNDLTEREVPLIIGVKVVPFMMKDLQRVLYLLKKDGSTDIVNRFFVQLFRKTWKKITLPWYKAKRALGIDYLSGNPKFDIIYARSRYGKNVFVCFNYNDLSYKNTNFVNSMKFIDSLHSLGWNSLMFADDSNRFLYFCMEEFGGTCSAIPYSMLYTASKQLIRVYDELSDLHKSSSPFYRKRVSIKKVLKESKVDVINSIFLEQNQIEDQKSLFFKLKNELVPAMEKGDISSIKKIIKRYEYLARGYTTKNYISEVKKTVSNFDSVYRRTFTALSNTLPFFKSLGKEVQELLVTVIILSGQYMSKAGKEIFRGIGIIVNKAYKFIKGDKDEQQWLMFLAGILSILFVSTTEIVGSVFELMLIIVGIILILKSHERI